MDFYINKCNSKFVNVCYLLVYVLSMLRVTLFTETRNLQVPYFNQFVIDLEILRNK